MPDDFDILQVVAEETGATEGIPRWRIIASLVTGGLIIPVFVGVSTGMVTEFYLNTSLQTEPAVTIAGALPVLAVSVIIGGPLAFRASNTLWLTKAERHAHDVSGISIPSKFQ